MSEVPLYGSAPSATPVRKTANLASLNANVLTRLK